MILEIALYVLMTAIVLIAVKPKCLNDFFKQIQLKKTKLLNLLPNVAKYTIFLIAAALVIGLFFNLIGMGKDAAVVSTLLKKMPFFEVAITVLFAAFAEEIMFRGYLQKRTNIIIASFLFAISHAGYGSITEMVGAFLLGIILAKQFEKTNNLWYPIAAHLLYDLVVLTLIFSV